MSKNKTVKIDRDQLIELVWGVCLADHLGDIMRQIPIITKKLGIKGEHGQQELLDKMIKKDMIPDYQREHM